MEKHILYTFDIRSSIGSKVNLCGYKIEVITEKLRKEGLDNIKSRILEAFIKEYPQLDTYDYFSNFPQEFFDLFWAREYHITRPMIYSDSELASLIVQIEAMVKLEHRNKAVGGGKDLKAGFDKKTVNELAQEYLTFLEEEYKRSPEDLDFGLRGFGMMDHLDRFWETIYSNVRSFDYLRRQKRDNVLRIVWPKWIQKMGDIELEKLPQNKKEEVTVFIKKTLTELSNEMIIFFRKKVSPLFDYSPQGRTHTQNEFWQTMYPLAPELLEFYSNPEGRDDNYSLRQLISQKKFRVEQLVNPVLPNIGQEVYDDLLKNVKASLEVKGKTSVSYPELIHMLEVMEILNPPQKGLLERLYRNINYNSN